MAGTPITDLSMNELPSPRGTGLFAEEEEVAGANRVPYFDQGFDDDKPVDSKDRFRLKIALEASQAKLRRDLNLEAPKRKVKTYTCLLYTSPSPRDQA